MKLSSSQPSKPLSKAKAAAILQKIKQSPPPAAQIESRNELWYRQEALLLNNNKRA